MPINCSSIFYREPKRNERFFYFQILYTQPNPSIKYEYFTESLSGEVETESVTKTDFPDVTPTSASKHFRRHHSYDAFSRPAPRHSDTSKEAGSNEDDLEEVVIGSRKFVWKILSYSQCTRSCGGGIQVSSNLKSLYQI